MIEGTLQLVISAGLREAITNFIAASNANVEYVRYYGLVVECLMQNEAFAAESLVDWDAVNYHIIGICICNMPVRRRA